MIFGGSFLKWPMWMVLINLFDKTIGPISFRDITQLCAVSWTIKDKDIAVSKGRHQNKKKNI